MPGPPAGLGVHSVHIDSRDPAKAKAKPKPKPPKKTKTKAPAKTSAKKSSSKSKVTSVAKTTKSSSKTSSGMTTRTTTASADGDFCELNPKIKNGKRAPTKCAKTLDPEHVTEITKSVAVLKTYTQTCSAAKAGQACYHYYSVIENNKAQNWDHFTCTDGQARHDGSATAVWENEHPKNGWRDYLPKAMTDARGVVSCQRDEYPPGYFNKAGAAQIIRWLPQKDNDAGGKVWAGFCNKYDGGKGNGQLRAQNKKKGYAEGEINNDLVKLGKKGNEKVKKPSPQAKATTTTPYEATFTRAVFKIEFDWGLKGAPNKGNDWFLSDNACWPKAIATDDPGYNLLTDDAWYTTAGTPQQQADRKKQKALYAKAPPANYVTKAIKPKKRNAAFLHEREFEILEDGYGVRHGNISRRLVDGEFEIIQCTSKDCKEERSLLSEDEIAAVIPAPEEKREMLPGRSEALPTAVPESKFIVSADKREAASPELPAATAGY
ncbi:hypothetical protein K505DRAFT_322158 [Melanomma pulvis-pyrius CBS 109.77]|uniref:Uncharacterized protein n=1 Tax=Melanomma pulvis-pyrius CBS 109.77 TaxID=1314802 RepID=A0A6A6XR97_9PLEO|nr:hypothetical protein K505DRAFT_322158 [Melanomma pulvis-pyrius CBS 109.77]